MPKYDQKESDRVRDIVLKELDKYPISNKIRLMRKILYRDCNLLCSILSYYGPDDILENSYIDDVCIDIYNILDDTVKQWFINGQFYIRSIMDDTRMSRAMCTTLALIIVAQDIERFNKILSTKIIYS